MNICFAFVLRCLTRIFAIIKPPKTLKLWHLSRLLKYLMNQNTYITCIYICIKTKST